MENRVIRSELQPAGSILRRDMKGLEKMLRRRSLLIFAVLLLSACSHAPETGGSPSNSASAGVFGHMLDFYAGPLNHLKAVRAGDCPMHPSCSAYAREAVARYGFFRGWMMAMDRLMRCGRDETRSAPRIRINGVWKYDDPVEDNALWQPRRRPESGEAFQNGLRSRKKRN